MCGSAKTNIPKKQFVCADCKKPKSSVLPPPLLKKSFLNSRKLCSNNCEKEGVVVDQSLNELLGWSSIC